MVASLLPLKKSVFFSSTANAHKLARLLSSSAFASRFTSKENLPTCAHLLIMKPKPYVYHVSLNRPECKNAINMDLWREIKETFDYLGSCSECRVVVFSGRGKAFSSGLDIKEAYPKLLEISGDVTLDVGRKALVLRDLVKYCQSSVSSIEKCEKPVIAAICGSCIGAGISLASAADVRIASEDAVFSIKEIDLGITADVGVLNRINKLVANDSVTRELAFTGRNFTAEDAVKLGFVSKKVSFENCLDAAIDLATEISSKSPVAIRGIKLMLNHARDHTIDDSLEYVQLWNQAFLQSEDLLQASAAFLSKGKPNFKNA